MAHSDRTARAVLLCVACLVLAAPALAEEPSAPARWKFAIEPYLWAAGIDGTVKYEIPPGTGNGGGPTIGLNPTDLKFPLMLTIEARKGKWAIASDLININIDSANSGVRSVRFETPGGAVEVGADANADTTTSLLGTEWELIGTYTAFRGRESAVEILAGVRYLTISVDTLWNLSADITGPGEGESFARQGSLSKHVALWDAVMGFRGELGLGGGHWFVPYYADVGMGDTSLTFQGSTGLAYRFKWGDLKLTYRYLGYRADESKVLDSVSLSGFAIGARFRL